MHDQAYYTDTPRAAVAAYRDADERGVLDSAVEINLRDHFPKLAAAYASWVAHLSRDEEQHDATQPMHDADGYVDLLDDTRVEFGPDQWSTWTREARQAYEAHLQIVLNTPDLG